VRHRCQQWQATAGLRDRFVGDTDRTALDQIGTLRRIGRKMQIGIENLSFAQHRTLLGLWFLDLDDHFGAGKNLRGGGCNDCAGLLVDLVGGADAFAGASFNRHLMAMGDHFPDR